MLNMDFSQRVVIETASMDWLPSPAAGVSRKPLAREDKESGHATSIVRYDAGSNFKAHPHPMGEEILVLEGTFSDESGDYSAGSYLRNPPGSNHAPFSEQGCIILVKLDQFDADDDLLVRINSEISPWQNDSDNLHSLELHEHGSEQTQLLRLRAGAALAVAESDQGEELLVISGSLQDEQQSYPAGSWIRSPHSGEYTTGDEETLIWRKTGHL